MVHEEFPAVCEDTARLYLASILKHQCVTGLESHEAQRRKERKGLTAAEGVAEREGGRGEG